MKPDYKVYIETDNENYFVGSYLTKTEAIYKANHPGPALRRMYEGKNAMVSVIRNEETIYQTEFTAV